LTFREFATNYRARIMSREMLRWLIVSFGFVGVNIGLLYVFVDLLAVPVLLATLVAAELGVLLRFLINDRWVFRQSRVTMQRLWQYHVAIAGSFTVWWVITNVIVFLGGHYMIASLAGMACSVLISIATNFFWIWTHPQAAECNSRAEPPGIARSAIERVKRVAVSILESHPLGYWVGVSLVSSTDVFLPHEPDYWGFRHLATKKRGVFLDIGANRGHSARGFAKIVKNWRIVSIEANRMHERTLSRLKRRLENFDYQIAAVDSQSNLSVTVYVPHYFGAPLHSAAALTMADARGGIEAWFPRHSARVTYSEGSVLTTTIDDLNVQPDIIKMDIQGKEMAALEGARETIARCSPAFLIEMLTNAEAIAAFLREYGYEAYSYDWRNDSFSRAVEPGAPLSRNTFFLRTAP
jgi:FkbM family methyltransferase